MEKNILYSVWLYLFQLVVYPKNSVNTAYLCSHYFVLLSLPIVPIFLRLGLLAFLLPEHNFTIYMKLCNRIFYRTKKRRTLVLLCVLLYKISFHNLLYYECSNVVCKTSRAKARIIPQLLCQIMKNTRASAH